MTPGGCPDCGGGPNVRYRVKAGSPFSHWVDCSNPIHRVTPNPTEEQTSPRTFEAWMTAHYNDQWRTDDADWIADQRAAWDARQPQVDRLRAALKRIASTATMASQGRTSGHLALIARAAREALDG